MTTTQTRSLSARDVYWRDFAKETVFILGLLALLYVMLLRGNLAVSDFSTPSRTFSGTGLHSIHDNGFGRDNLSHRHFAPSPTHET